VASLDQGGTGIIWDTDTWQQLTSVPCGKGRRITFTPDGRRLIVGGADGRVVVWDGETNDPLPGASDPRQETALAWHKAELRSAETRGDRFAAGFHADRLADLAPWDPAPCHRAAHHWAAAGQTARAARSYPRARNCDTQLDRPISSPTGHSRRPRRGNTRSRNGVV
jgi:WD40 repeat protein